MNYPDPDMIMKINYRDGRCCHNCNSSKSGECIKHKIIVYHYAICNDYICLGDKKEQKMGRIISGILMILVSSCFCVLSIVQCSSAKIEYHNEVSYAWDLADKSSTLSEKSRYVDEFISNLKKIEHTEYGAMVFKTKEKRFDLNLKALESLGKRLKEVQKLDINSFAYQTAIQQITGQEQGEATAMLWIFYNSFILEKYWWGYEAVVIWVWSLWTCICCVGAFLIYFGKSSM